VYSPSGLHSNLSVSSFIWTMKASSFSESYVTLCFFFNSDSPNMFAIAVLSYHTVLYSGTLAIFLVVLVPGFVANSRVVLDSLMFVTIFGLPNKLSVDPLSNRMLSSLVLDAHCSPLLCRLSFFIVRLFHSLCLSYLFDLREA
jgi:hypothetical protein